MNRIDELEAQNLQDCWTLLYRSLAQTLLNWHGQSGATALRQAIRRYGSRIGSLEREKHMENGIKVNLYSLYQQPYICFGDPRYRIDEQRVSEEEALFDVITCPVCELLRICREEELCRYYCEEFTHACVEAYSLGVAQTNLSEQLTRKGENSCRFACYFRPANTPESERAISFSAFAEAENHPVMPTSPKQAWQNLAVMLVDSFATTCADQFGLGSDYLVACALKTAAQEILFFLADRADAVGAAYTPGFMAANCPFDPADPPKTAGPDVQKLIVMNFCSVVSSQLRSNS